MKNSIKETIKRSKLLVNLGTVIQKRRNAVPLSQEEFAHIAGFDRTYISLVERGKRNLSLLNLQVFAKTLKCKPSELLAEAENGA